MRGELLNTEDILKDCKRSSIAVIGDICLDSNYFLKHEHEELSVETGLRSNSVFEFSSEVGGAGNVAVNCSTMGISHVDIYGIIGADLYGRLVIELLEAAQVNTKGIVVQQEQWATHVYHKIYDEQQEQPRFDIGNFNVPRKSTLDLLIENIANKIHEYEVIIINEQVLQGLHDEYFQKVLNELIEQNPDILWLSDCRRVNDVYRGTIRKLSTHEAMLLMKANTVDPLELEAAQEDDGYLASWLYEYWNTPVVMTRGENGTIAVDAEGRYILPGIHMIQPVDTVGAGDAFISGLAAALSVGASVREAAAFGNISAGVSIQKLYKTGHPTAEEIRTLAVDTDYRYNPVLAADARKAVYVEHSEIEIINPNIIQSFSEYPKVAIYDHDGTISVLRRGWEPIMVATMVKNITGKAFASISGSRLEEITQQVVSLIDKTTGVQTIIQMHELVHLIRSNKLVPEDDILSPQEYKKIYNDELLKKVAIKREHFLNKRLVCEDLTMKGAVSSLEKFSSMNTRIYLASGTDVEDVKEEASLLGYADYFTGGIYGSVGDIDQDPKRKVIKQIIAGLESRGKVLPHQCVVFGDGPVEIREAKKHGLVAIGIVSDESQRFGLNLGKRERLVLAGADLLIPDFSWFEEVSLLLGWEHE